METPELIRDVINEENSDVNSEGLKVGLTEGVKLVRFDITMLGLADSPKLEKTFSLLGLFLECNLL